MRKIPLFSVACLMFIYLPLTAHAQKDKKSGPAGNLHSGDPAPDFTLHGMEGKTTVKLSDLKGKPVVLFFGSCT